MKERPIIFNSADVKAVIEGRKTQTRRVVKDRRWAANSSERDDDNWPMTCDLYGDWLRVACPYGKIGDRLWVRETCAITDNSVEAKPHYHATDGTKVGLVTRSIHMPRWASRITLDVISVRVERLQDISDADAMMEGCASSPNWQAFGTVAFRQLWDYVNAKRAPWSSNPWVWVIEFKRVL